MACPENNLPEGANDLVEIFSGSVSFDRDTLFTKFYGHAALGFLIIKIAKNNDGHGKRGDHDISYISVHSC